MLGKEEIRPTPFLHEGKKCTGFYFKLEGFLFMVVLGQSGEEHPVWVLRSYSDIGLPQIVISTQKEGESIGFIMKRAIVALEQVLETQIQALTELKEVVKGSIQR